MHACVTARASSPERGEAVASIGHGVDERDLIRIGAAFGLHTAMSVVIALVAGSTRPRAALGIALGTLNLAVPFIVPEEHTLVRFVLLLGTVVAFMRPIDLARDRRVWPLRTRLWLLTAIFDVRRVTPTAARVRIGEIAAALGYLALAAGGFYVALAVAPALAAPASLPIRWLGGVVGMYGAHDLAGRTLTEIYVLGGKAIPTQLRAPILADSVGAFWSRHWNLTISEWLGRNIQLPLVRRRRPRLAIAAAFAASALLHFWTAFVPLDLSAGASMGSFFLVEGALVGAERRLGVRRWRRPFRHVWTIACLILPSPLFIEPLLRIVEGG